MVQLIHNVEIFALGGLGEESEEKGSAVYIRGVQGSEIVLKILRVLLFVLYIMSCLPSPSCMCKDKMPPTFQDPTAAPPDRT